MGQFAPIKQIKWVAVVLVFCGLMGLNARAAEEAAPQPPLSSVMQKNYLTLIRLQQLALRPEQFANVDNMKQIQTYLETLAQTSTHVKKLIQERKQEGLAPIADIYVAYVQDLPKRYEEGHREYVRQKVGTVSQLCMSCHTGVASKQVQIDSEDSIAKMKLSPAERVQMYAATRQFDKAINALDALLKQGVPENYDLYPFTQAIKATLSVSVRAEESPTKSLQIVNKVLALPKLPDFLKRDFNQWKADLEAWQAEKPSGKMTASQQITRAKQLIDSARELQEYPTDHIADIRYLRASNLLQQAIQQKPSAKQKAEAFYLLGICYETMRDPLLWNLDQYYYEACIHTLPHSSQSRSCFHNLSSDVYFGYTGSAGTKIPPDEVKRLNDLRRLTD